MAEELVPETATFRRPLDQARDVGDHELDRVGVLAARTSNAYDPEVGLEGREGIVGDLRLRGRDGRNERGLAGVREPDEGHVCHQLELEVQPVLLAELGLLGEGRRPEAVAQETGVPPPAPPAGRRHVTVSTLGEVGEHLGARTADDRADRDGDDEVGAVATMPFLPAAVSPVPGAPVRVVDKRKQRGEIRGGLEVDTASLAAVTSVRTALGDVCLPAERDSPGSTVAPLYMDLGLVDKGRGHLSAALQSQFEERSVG